MPISNRLLQQLANNEPKIKKLNLSSQIDNDDDIEFLIDALKNNTHLHSLTIRGRCPLGGRSLINDRTAILLAEKCKSLTRLDISNNAITDDAIPALAASSLQHLSVNGCPISIVGSSKFLNSNSLCRLDQFRCLEKASDNELKEILQLTGIDISPVLLNEALTGYVDAKLQIVKYLNKVHQAGRNIEGCKISFLRTTHSSEDIKSDLLSVAARLLAQKIDKRLEDNRARRDFEYARNLQLERRREELEKSILRAVDVENIKELSHLIPQLEQGVNPYILWMNCYLMAYCLDKNKCRVVEFLLAHGTNLEAQEKDNKTILKEATEEGKVDFVKLFLRRGANITGEFHFNKETVFSVAAFKMNHALSLVLEKHHHLIDQLQKGIQNKVRQYMEKLDRLFQGVSSAWTECSEKENWLNEDSKFALIVIRHLNKLSELQNNEDLKKANTFAEIYRFMHDKIAVLKRKNLLNQEEYFKTLGQEKCYRLIPLVKPYDEQSRLNLDKISLQKKVDALNAELMQCKETDLDWSKYPKLFIAQYRGIHYYTHYFDENQRKEHMFTSHLGAHGYPHYAMSDLPEHPLRYGYGLKSVEGLAYSRSGKSNVASRRLQPEYDKNGKPKHPILGKVFISLLTPFEMAKERMRHAVGMHNREELTLGKTIAPERETGPTGGFEAGYVFL